MSRRRRARQRQQNMNFPRSVQTTLHPRTMDLMMFNTERCSDNEYEKHFTEDTEVQILKARVERLETSLQQLTVNYDVVSRQLSEPVVTMTATVVNKCSIFSSPHSTNDPKDHLESKERVLLIISKKKVYEDQEVWIPVRRIYDDATVRELWVQFKTSSGLNFTDFKLTA